MTTTIGQVVSELFRRYQRKYRDDELAALATAVVLGELFAARPTTSSAGSRAEGSTSSRGAAPRALHDHAHPS